MKQIGYDDNKIEGLVNFIASNSYYNKYVDGLQLQSDVTPAVVEQRQMAMKR